MKKNRNKQKENGGKAVLEGKQLLKRGQQDNSVSDTLSTYADEKFKSQQRH